MSSVLLPTDEPSPAAAGGQRSTALPWAAIAVTAVAMLATWLLSGVGTSVVLRFLAFEALYVVLPGCLLYVLLSPSPDGRLRTLAIGWPLGYAMEVGAFALTAALHARGTLALLPLVSLPLGGAMLMRSAARRRLRALTARRAGTSSASGPSLLVGLAIAAALVLLAFTFFASSPLPEHARSVSYSEDNVFDITLAGEARRHWPITESWVAGEPLKYYTAVFQHAAALNQVMGISLATAFLRLLPSTMFLIAALQLCALGRSLGRSRWIGPVGAALLLVTQDVNLDATKSVVLQINPFTQFPFSPTFAFGVPFFLGGLLLVQSRFAREDDAKQEGAAGLLLMVGAFVAGLASAKAFGAFDFVGGLGLYWLWRILTGRGSRTLTCCVLVAGVAMLAVYFLMIAGGGAATMGVHPLAFLREGSTLEHATHLAKDLVGPSLYWLVLGAGALVLAPAALAPLLGAGWQLWKDRGACDATALPLAVFLVGLAGYVLLGAPGGVEGVFFVYGYIALLPIAALGLVRLWEETPMLARGGMLRACAVLLALALAFATIAASVALTGLARDAWLAAAYGSIATGALLAVWRLRRRYALSLASRWARLAACAIPLLLALALVKPVTLAGAGAWRTAVGKPTSLADTPIEYGMTAALYAGLRWVRAHTTPCEVLAVNNHYDNAERAESVYFYYSAFTERRVFLESWHHTAGGQTLALPYPGRFALNQRATQQGDPRALRELARRGVSYVLIDRTHVGGATLPASVSTLVFANGALDVYRLAGARPKC